MTRVEAIKGKIQELSPEELFELRDWIRDQDWERWNRQIERDAAGGRLEPLFERALAAHRQCKSREV